MVHNLIFSDDGKKILGANMQNTTILFRVPRNASDAEESVQFFRNVDETCILNGKPESIEGAHTTLTKQELRDFLKGASETQRDDFVSPLAKAGAWVSMKPLRKAYYNKHHPKSETSAGIAFAGIQGSMTKVLNGLHRETFWERKFNQADEEYDYRVKPQYLQVVREVLSELTPP